MAAQCNEPLTGYTLYSYTIDWNSGLGNHRQPKTNNMKTGQFIMSVCAMFLSQFLIWGAIVILHIPISKKVVSVMHVS